ncbi:carcinoembryonic antigen-related cell adhesion molecule 1-like [Labeo rohita]|uniref:carcinoembryonic antigen-related cell adhesion molecule 1-like n=1 Tax=Labeo rohita TaxID=84645 RepID=UPI0021E1C498|nr:carcinoembryonic antigen-related cell adhesion molecule 1-like [Labeo rohita]
MSSCSGFVTLDQLSVTCNQQSICAVKGSEVTLKCFYFNINIKTVFWFSEKQSTNWRKNNEPENLTLDSDYSGRVKHQISYSSSTLTISDARERDSGEYQLMFIMNDGVKHLRSAAVSLTVTDLQMTKNPAFTDKRDERVKLTCNTSCDLTPGVRYYWIKNGRHFTNTESGNMFVSPSSDSGSFSCSRDQNLKRRSSSVCVSQSVCWDVTYTSRRVCALVNSTVDISCTYTHPSGHTVNKTFWHYGRSRDVKDLREEHQFAGRVEYVGNKLRIKDLKISDSGEYRFRIITDLNQYSGSPGVILTVTGAEKKSNKAVVSEKEEVILRCSTNCTLNENHTYIWYKNGRQVTDGFTKVNKLYLDSVSNEELQQYSCAVGDPAVQIISSPKANTALLITVIILSVFLIFTLIGVLWYRRRKNNSPQQYKDNKGSVQLGSDMLYENAAALSTVYTQQVHTKDQDVHYSTINFKQSHTKNTSSAPTAVDSTTDDVHYAAVKFS